MPAPKRRSYDYICKYIEIISYLKYKSPVNNKYITYKISTNSLESINLTDL